MASPTMLRGARSLISRPAALAAESRPSPPQGLAARVAALEARVAALEAGLEPAPARRPAAAARSCPSTPGAETSPARFEWSSAPPLSLSPSPAPAPSPSPAPAAPLVVKGQTITTRESLGKLQLVELKVNELHQLCDHFQIVPPKRSKKQSLVALLSTMD